MAAHSQHGGRRGVLVAAAITAVLTASGVGVVLAGRTDGGPPVPPAPVALSQAATPSASPTVTGGTTSRPTSGTARSDPPAADFGPVLRGSTPVSLDIPSIGVHARRIVDLGYTEDGALEVPTDFDLPGWFSPGPTPGEFGPAVIAGHVDSKRRPAVFYRLGALRPGAMVTVGRKDGTTATFRVDAVRQYPKDRFPTSAVYGNTTNRAELRLITCGGSFDRGTGHYRDNVVAFAHLVA